MKSYNDICQFQMMYSRSPCGERGLKLALIVKICTKKQSLPMRGAWIEIYVDHYYEGTLESLPMRGAWIEIYYSHIVFILRFVAPHAGSVD